VIGSAKGDPPWWLTIWWEKKNWFKALDDRLVASELVSGASILGDGSVVLILNVPAVISYLGNRKAERLWHGATRPVLVIDDPRSCVNWIPHYCKGTPEFGWSARPWTEFSDKRKLGASPDVITAGFGNGRDDGMESISRSWALPSARDCSQRTQ